MMNTRARELQRRGGGTTPGEDRHSNVDGIHFEGGDWVSYSACAVPCHVRGEIQGVEDRVVSDPEKLVGKYGIDLRRFLRLLDPMATSLEAGGVEPPREVEARSPVPLLEGGYRRTGRRRSSPSSTATSSACTHSGWSVGPVHTRLQRPLHERVVRSVRGPRRVAQPDRPPPEYREIREEHERRLGEWMRETGDPLWPWTRKPLAD
jgi:hypothetical protein